MEPELFADVATCEELDYERPEGERFLAESWESSRFNVTGGEFSEQDWQDVVANASE